MQILKVKKPAESDYLELARAAPKPIGGVGSSLRGAPKPIDGVGSSTHARDVGAGTLFAPRSAHNLAPPGPAQTAPGPMETSLIVCYTCVVSKRFNLFLLHVLGMDLVCSSQFVKTPIA